MQYYYYFWRESLPYSHNVAQFEASLNQGTTLVVTSGDCPPSSGRYPGCIWSLRIIIQRHVGQVPESNHWLRSPAFNGHVPPCHPANHAVQTELSGRTMSLANE